jgi:uncharacterized protein (TIGR02453 family)
VIFSDRKEGRDLRNRFNGFYPETLQFFTDIRFHNNKTWFEEHRDDFEAYVKSPMEALALDLEPLMNRLDPALDTRVRRVVSRIYRDARYAHGVPYRDHMWLSYKPVGKGNSEAFTFYFYIQDDAWGAGVGFYEQVPELQQRFRQRLITQGGLWRSILALPQMASFQVSGELIHRKMKIDLPEDLSQWYHYKKFDFDASQPAGPILFSADLLNQVSQIIENLEPAYRFVQGWDVDI